MQFLPVSIMAVLVSPSIIAVLSITPTTHFEMRSSAPDDLYIVKLEFL